MMKEIKENKYQNKGGRCNREWYAMGWCKRKGSEGPRWLTQIIGRKDEEE